ncbi:MAG: sigma-70 family RNA polymerase sigma factor [Ruminococcus sp.]|nr:sigma-70 family RNA polymerase sigma factor [Ruminococcus sp.]
MLWYAKKVEVVVGMGACIMSDFEIKANDFSLLDDEALTECARNDSTAASELISRLAPSIRSMAISINPQISEDLFQEGMLGALSAISSFDADRGSARAYLMTCAKNKMLSAVKKNSLLTESSDELDETEDAQGEAVRLDRERLATVYHAIEECLTKTECDVLMSYLTGLSYREIAQSIGLSEKAVDNAMQRARRKLREGLR